MDVRKPLAIAVKLLILVLVAALWVGGPFAAFFAPSPVVFVEERVQETKTVETSVKLTEASPVPDSPRSTRRAHTSRGEPQPAKRPSVPIRNVLRAAPLVVRLRL